MQKAFKAPKTVMDFFKQRPAQAVPKAAGGPGSARPASAAAAAPKGVKQITSTKPPAPPVRPRQQNQRQQPAAATPRALPKTEVIELLSPSKNCSEAENQPPAIDPWTEASSALIRSVAGHQDRDSGKAASSGSDHASHLQNAAFRCRQPQPNSQATGADAAGDKLESSESNVQAAGTTLTPGTGLTSDSQAQGARLDRSEAVHLDDGDTRTAKRIKGNDAPQYSAPLHQAPHSAARQHAEPQPSRESLQALPVGATPIQTIMGMGFTAQQAERALWTTNGNLERAVERILCGL